MAGGFNRRSILQAYRRRAARGTRSGVKLISYVREVLDKHNAKLEERVRVATQYLHTKTVKNLSTPVVKMNGPRGGRVVLNRSKPGEYPHAETTQLMKTLGWEVVRRRNGVVEGIVGTPLDYGLILETRMNRSFLKRTLKEELGKIKKTIGKQWFVD